MSAFPSASQRRLLAELEERDARERSEGLREGLSLRALAPPVARLLHLLAVSKGARSIAEFGTSHGYSTIHLAAAAATTGGHVHTVDAMLEKTALARANLETAGLRDRVTLATCDGAEFAASLPPEVDFVLVDYSIPAFEPAYPALRERLAPGCLVFVDGGPDGYWDEGSGLRFRTLLEDDPELLVTVVPMNKEQLIALRLPL